MTKKVIEVSIIGPWKSPRTIDPYDLTGSIDSAINMLQSFKEEYPGTDLRLSWDSEEYDGDYTFCLKERRTETDDEYNKRVAQDKIVKEFSEKREREQLAKLMKKYGEDQ